MSDISNPDLRLSFRSHQEEGVPPRYEEEEYPVLHTAVSFWRTREQGLTMGRVFYPKHGEYLAQVVLTFGHSFEYLDQAVEKNPLHLRVWGDPVKLAHSVVDIFPIEE